MDDEEGCKDVYTIEFNGSCFSNNNQIDSRTDRDNKRTLRHTKRNLDKSNPTNLWLRRVHCTNDEWLVKEIKTDILSENKKDDNDNDVINWNCASFENCGGNVSDIVALALQNKFKALRVFGSNGAAVSWDALSVGIQQNKGIKTITVQYIPIQMSTSTTATTTTSGNQNASQAAAAAANNSGNNSQPVDSVIDNHCLEGLIFDNCTFDNQDLTAMGKSLFGCHTLKFLKFYKCGLRHDHQLASLINQMIGGTTSLLELDLSFNNTTMDGYTALSKFLQHENCKLSKLNLSHQRFNGDFSGRGRCFTRLFQGLEHNKSLTVLNLGNSAVTDCCIPALVAALEKHTHLIQLDLHRNVLKDNGATLLAKCLAKQSNNNIQYVNAWGCQILQTGWLALMDALKSNPNLYQVVDESRLDSVQRRHRILALTTKQERSLFHEQDYNTHGRKLILQATSIPIGLWPIVLERAWNVVSRYSNFDQSFDARKEAKISIVYRLFRNGVALINNNDKNDDNYCSGTTAAPSKRQLEPETNDVTTRKKAKK